MATPAIIMLDTNIASHYIRGKNLHVREHIREVSISKLCLSSICEAELRYGLAKRPEAKQLAREVESFLTLAEILPWDSDAAYYYAKLRASLEGAGTPLGGLDTLIAAHALSLGALLITNDRAFQHVKGLKTANWTKP